MPYEAACSDAHKPRDIEIVVQSIERLEALVGVAEAKRLLADRPRAILGDEGWPPASTSGGRAMKERVGVIGLGYVGLPVALAFARKFPDAVGFDVHRDKVDELRRGIDRNSEQPRRRSARRP